MLQRRSPVALIKSRFSPGHSTRPHKPLGRLLRILESTVGCLGAFWGSLEALWALTSVSEEGWAGRRPISEGEVATRSASLERRRFGAEGICTIAQSERPGPRSHPKSPQVTEQRARACRYARAAMPRGVCVCGMPWESPVHARAANHYSSPSRGLQKAKKSSGWANSAARSRARDLWVMGPTHQALCHPAVGKTTYLRCHGRGVGGGRRHGGWGLT